MNRVFERSCLVAGSIAALMTLAEPAHAFRDCCFARRVPPTLIGVNFGGRIDDVLDRLERAGFGDYDPGNRRIAGLGYLLDSAPVPAPPVGSGEIGGQLLTPSISCFEMMCAGYGRATLTTMGGHPNGARRLVAVIAVVADLDLACAQFADGSRPWSTRFGPEYEDPALGARVREAPLGLARLRVMEPNDPHGAAARWLADGGPRWLGFAVEVGDLYATEQWLARTNLPFARETGHGETALRIDPEYLDGLLVEFVPSGRF